ncbi:MAG: chitobiase/beta-hexosaminidase C-terminal domain-containing protein [Treponema sp.]|nr:chitobiase/beta-hexosaminidase C-terminal domain-containing protein [Treponema sp.]
MRRNLLAAAEHFRFRARFVPQLANARSLRDWLGHCSIAGRHFLFILAFFSLLPAFSERVISPVSGTFANRQTLVLELPKGAEAFYSYTNTNPLTSGFAYDGPVLLDVSGDVSLRVAVVDDGKTEQYKIDYKVADKGNPFAEGTAEKTFIDRIYKENVLICSGENVISVPSSFSLSIGDGEKPVLKGGTLAVSADNRLARYIPCRLTNGNEIWRFILFLSGGEAGTFAKANVPFKIDDWTTFRFTGKNLIWCIDGGLWSASKEEILLDRTEKHVVYWQNVAYKAGNPVYSFELPPKPELKTERFEKSVVFTLEGDLRYKLSIVSSGAEGQAYGDAGLYNTLTFDTVDGDYVNAMAVFALYCDGVYQGELSLPYEIDRQPPLPPEFIASEPGAYARKDVQLSIKSEKEAKIYLALSGPHVVSSNSYLDNNSEFDFLNPGEFVLYKSQPLELRAGVEGAVCYKAFAYAEDTFGNVSGLSTYQVIIDEFNYFIDGSASDFAADGSRLHPYNSFEQALRVINEGKFVHFFVSGSVPLPRGNSLISSNCSFTGMADARLLIPSDSYLTVRDASFEVQNCVIEKELPVSTDSDFRFLSFERAAASFLDCELVSSFSADGTALLSDASIVTFKNSGLTVQSQGYACALSANNSRLQFTDSHFAVISDTAVNFSLKGGSFDLLSCECKLVSHLGRVIESGGANLKMRGNSFIGDFDRDTKGVKAVWKDEKTLVIEDKNNKITGF